MLRTTESIVLKSSLYGEADLLVTFFTLDFGLLRAFAKSPRKLKSRFGSSLEPLTYSRISFWGKEDASLPRLTQSDILKSFQDLREELNCFMMLSEMIEILMGLMPERETNRKVFSLMKAVMEMMESDCSRLNSLLFKIKFLELKGYAPRLVSCARCGREAQIFYKSQGSVICNSCQRKADSSRLPRIRDDAVEISKGSIRFYETLRSWELLKISRIRVTDSMLSELSGLIDAHIQHVLSRPLRVKSIVPAV